MFPLLPGMVQWCSLCRERPAQGMLTIIPKGEVVEDIIPACKQCVNDIKEEDWL